MVYCGSDHRTGKESFREAKVTDKTTLVTAAVIRKNDSVLLARRAPGESLAGFWEFPGGKLRSGEALADCLERELLEELHIKTTIGQEVARSRYTYEKGEITLVALSAAIISGTITLTVHDKVEWVPVAKLLSFKLSPADIPIAKTLMEEPK